MFLERLLEEHIEHLVPNQMEESETAELVDIVKDDIIRLRLGQLLPPVPEIKQPQGEQNIKEKKVTSRKEQLSEPETEETDNQGQDEASDNSEGFNGTVNRTVN